MIDLAADYRLLRDGVGALRLDRDVVLVSGADAVGFLQGQCSQDVAALAEGASAWSLVLQPQGKIDALVRVTHLARDRVVLDTDRGWGPALLERLNRFKLRVTADISPLPWRCIALRGPGIAGTVAALSTGPDDLVLDASWPGLPGADLLGPGPSWPAGIPEVRAEAFEVTRIEAGVPAMGAELTERTIPAETGLIERAVSFTKGCYTGQELVARIDSRGGHVPRHLRGVLFAGGVAPVGATLLVGGKKVGVITSTAPAPGGGGVGLAYVGRDVEPPAEIEATWDAGATSASVRALPLVE